MAARGFFSSSHPFSRLWGSSWVVRCRLKVVGPRHQTSHWKFKGPNEPSSEKPERKPLASVETSNRLIYGKGAVARGPGASSPDLVRFTMPSTAGLARLGAAGVFALSCLGQDSVWIPHVREISIIACIGSPFPQDGDLSRLGSKHNTTTSHPDQLSPAHTQAHVHTHACHVVRSTHSTYHYATMSVPSPIFRMFNPGKKSKEAAAEQRREQLRRAQKSVLL